MKLSKNKFNQYKQISNGGGRGRRRKEEEEGYRSRGGGKDGGEVWGEGEDQEEGGRGTAADYLHLSPRVWAWLHVGIDSPIKPEPPQAFPVWVCVL